MGRYSNEQKFIHKYFLLESDSSRILYHDYAKNLPIIDYHSHLSPKAISDNKIFDSITTLWLKGDHYKWRALRTLGIDEKYITGNSSNKEKFIKYCCALPLMIRNPLYHWSHLELKRYFGISDLISEKNAEDIFNKINKLLVLSEFNTISLLEKMKVEQICTTDDPLDNLEYHKSYKNPKNYTKMNPTFRPDKFIFIESSNYNKLLDALEAEVMFKIKSFDILIKRLSCKYYKIPFHLIRICCGADITMI